MKKYFRTIQLSILVIILLTIIIGCRQKETVKIGLLTDITGRSSLMGVSGRNALNLAVEEYNKQSGKYRIEIVIKDDKGLKKEMDKAMEEFDKENVQLIIGPYTSNIAEEIMEKNWNTNENILFINPTVSGSMLEDIDDQFITLLSTNNEQGVMLAQKAYKDGLRKIAAVYEYNNRSYSETVANAFIETFEQLGGVIVSVNHFTSSEDAPFFVIAQKIASSEADGALVVAGGLDASQLVQFIHKEKPDLPVFSGMWAKTHDYISNGSSAVEGTFLVGISEGDEENPEFLEFSKNYDDSYHTEITFSVVCTYEAAKMLFSALESSHSKDPLVIKNEITKNLKYTGLSNDLTLDTNGDSERPYILYEVTKGKFVKVAQ